MTRRVKAPVRPIEPFAFGQRRRLYRGAGRGRFGYFFGGRRDRLAVALSFLILGVHDVEDAHLVNPNWIWQLIGGGG